MLPKNIPLGISQIYDVNSNTTQLSFSYVENAEIEHFEIQYWNDNERQWMPFDGRNGIITKK